MAKTRDPKTAEIGDTIKFPQGIKAKSTPYANPRENFQERTFMEGKVCYFHNGKTIICVGKDTNGLKCFFKAPRE
jgi:hypothetical protein